MPTIRRRILLTYCLEPPKSYIMVTMKKLRQKRLVCSCICLMATLIFSCGKEKEPIDQPTDTQVLGSSTRKSSKSIYQSLGNNIFYMINPDSEISGPIHNGTNDSAYISQIFGLITQSAHKIAKSYYDAEDFEAYYAFLLGALTVPYHESFLLHFRQKIGSGCIQALNSGELLKRVDAQSYSIFEDFFKSGGKPTIPPCSTFDPQTSYTQLLSSHAYSDTGIMQIAIRWHKSHVASGELLNVAKAIRYGLSYYYQGFSQLYSQYATYPCIVDREGQIDYQNLIRGAWSRYNGGSNKKFCRFSNKNDRWIANDQVFEQALLTLLQSSEHPYLRFLALREKTAFLELIDNFKFANNKREALDRVISATYAGTALPTANDRKKAEKQAEIDDQTAINGNGKAAGSDAGKLKIVNAHKLNIRNAPSTDGKICGYLLKNTYVDIISDEKWAQISLPPTSVLNDQCNETDSFYVYNSYLEEKRSTQRTYGKIIDAYFLNVRQTPPQGLITHVLKAGDIVQIVSEKNLSGTSSYPWYQISLGSDQGWIYGKYVSILATPALH